MNKKDFLKGLAHAGLLAVNLIVGYTTVKTTSEIYVRIIERIDKKGGDR